MFDGKYPARQSMELMVYPQRQSVVLAIRKLRICGFIRATAEGYSLQASGTKVVPSTLESSMTGLRVISGFLIGKTPLNIMKINMASILSFRKALVHVDQSNGKSSEQVLAEIDKLNNDPKSKYRISDLGDLWLELWCLRRCISDGIDSVVENYPCLDINKDIYAMIMKKSGGSMSGV
jgi:hypothetical protein